jgi:hypothetical protein
MSRNTKNILTVLIVALVFCIIGVVAAIGGVGLVADKLKANVASDPAKVKEMANAFVSYELPAGYSETMGFNFLVYKMVLISSSESAASTKPIIFLANFDSSQNMSPEEMTSQMQKSLEQQSGQKGSNFKVVETRTVTIDGKDESLAVSEGDGSNGKTMRQWVTSFPGKTGIVIVMIQGYTSDWDDALYNEFLSSLSTK